MEIAPKKSSDNSLWEDSFWEEYDNSTSRTLKCFEEELITILSADKDYIIKMINERPKHWDFYATWHESMAPLFEKALAE